MNKYEKLKTVETARGLSEDFRKEFEEELSQAICHWQEHGKLVDKFEDEPMDLSFAKGFLAGCISTLDKTIDKACEFFDEHLCCYIKAQDFTIEHSRLENDFKKFMERE